MTDFVGKIQDIDESKVPDLEGIFEVHLIVRPEDEVGLFTFCMDKEMVSLTNTLYFNVKPTCALSFYGNFPKQPMLTFWFHGNSRTAVLEAKKVAITMMKRGMVVGRLKVEAMANEKTIKALEHTSNNYFEFHFKVNILNMDEWEKLRNICLPFGSHLFFNPYSKTGTMQPVVTLRRYDVNFATADADNEMLMKKISLSGFQPPEKIQKEYSIIDSDVNYDKGWLFKDDPKKFIVAV